MSASPSRATLLAAALLLAAAIAVIAARPVAFAPDLGDGTQTTYRVLNSYALTDPRSTAVRLTRARIAQLGMSSAQVRWAGRDAITVTTTPITIARLAA